MSLVKNTLQFKNLKTVLTRIKFTPKLSNIKFGNIFTSHILQVDYNSKTGWDNPIIRPYQDLNLSPAASILHYGFGVFEGMKAFKHTHNSDVYMFRPFENLRRMNSSSKRLCLPTFEEDELLRCIKELLKIDDNWIPTGVGNSLYIRPTLISTDPDISIRTPQTAKLFVILSPAVPLYNNISSNKNKSNPPGLKLMVYPNSTYTRAWIGGTGSQKVCGNYAPALLPQLEAQKNGCQQVLWLNDQNISEAGTMNIFFFRESSEDTLQLITPRLDGTILPGITRDSILQLTKDRVSNIQVIDNINYSIDELIDDFNNNRIMDIFGTGTAATISNIEEIYTQDNLKYRITNPYLTLSKDLHTWLTNIQYGLTEDPYNWRVSIFQ